jgi:TPR repeat protein
MISKEEKKDFANGEDLYQKAKTHLDNVITEDGLWVEIQHTQAVDNFLEALDSGISIERFSKECIKKLMYSHSYMRHRTWEEDIQKKVAVLLIKAVKHGCAEAQFELGELQSDGRDPIETGAIWSYRTESDDNINRKLAFDWYEKAAAQGYAEAQNELGYRYTGANGTEINLQKAVFWLEKAAAQGHPAALRHLGDHYFSIMTKTETNYIRAAKYYIKSIEQRNYQIMIDPFSQYFYLSHLSDLIDIYLTGKGLPINRVKATRLLFQGEKYQNEVLKCLEGIIKSELSRPLKSSLSYTQACILFYAGNLMLKLYWDKSTISIPKEGEPRRVASSSQGYEPPPYEIPRLISEKIYAGFKLVLQQYPDLFYSLIDQNFSEKEIQSHIKHAYPEYRAIFANIHKKLEELKQEKFTVISDNTGLLPVILPLITEYAQGKSFLSIEIFADYVTSLEEKLYGFNEHPGSSNAEFSNKLLKKLIPFKQMLTREILPYRAYDLKLIELRTLLKDERKRLLPDNRSGFYKANSEIVDILEETIQKINSLAQLDLVLESPLTKTTPINSSCCVM